MVFNPRGDVMPGSGWFTPEGSDASDQRFPESDERTVPLHTHTVEENAKAAKAALDEIQGKYTEGADQVQREFTDHARQIQERIRPPEWPT
jgi:anti-sigma factor ChrR (cupin superfamily)